MPRVKIFSIRSPEVSSAVVFNPKNNFVLHFLHTQSKGVSTKNSVRSL